MDLKTRRAALAAASRVALGALSLTSVAGCGGKTVGDFAIDSEPTAAEAPTTSPTPTATPTPAPVPSPTGMVYDAGIVDPPAPEDAGSTLACTEPVGLSLYYEPPISDAAFNCCVTYVVAHSLLDGGTDPSLDNCCNAVIIGVDYDTDGTRYNLGLAARDQCCFVDNQDQQLELWQHYFCTPWGPPVPPSLEAELLGVA